MVFFQVKSHPKWKEVAKVGRNWEEMYENTARKKSENIALALLPSISMLVTEPLPSVSGFGSCLEVAGP